MAAMTKLRTELLTMKPSALRKRALKAGVGADAVTDAVDADDPKEALIELLITTSTVQSSQPRKVVEVVTAAKQRAPGVKSAAPSASTGSNGVPVEDSETQSHRRRPHHGVTVLPQSPAATPAPALMVPSTAVTKQLHNAKHAMLSYAWGKTLKTQQLVIRVRDDLTARGINVWMDISGGMQGDIFASMASAVENAAVIIPFLNMDYQLSSNCQLELKFARQNGVPICPVMLSTSQGDLSSDADFKPSGWLGKKPTTRLR